MNKKDKQWKRKKLNKQTNTNNKAMKYNKLQINQMK